MRIASGLGQPATARAQARLSFDVDAMIRLWPEPLADCDEEAAAATRQFHTDPSSTGGTAGRDLVTRARTVPRTFDRRDTGILDVVQVEDIAVAFRMSGLQVGPLATTLGPLPPSGSRLEMRVVDILVLTDGKVSKIWMVADELGALVAANAVTWT